MNQGTFMSSAVEEGGNLPFRRSDIDKWRQKLFDNRNLHVPAAFLQKVALDFYLWIAVFQAAEIDKARGQSKQNWQTPAWDFGRFAKAHPSLIDLESDTALQLVRETIGAEFWSKHLDMNPSDAEMAFDAIWNGCKSPLGQDPISTAIGKAQVQTNDGSPNSPAGYNLFVAVARNLQEAAGEKPIQLPVKLLAQKLGCLSMTITRFRQKAIRDGRLQVVKHHTFRSGGGGEATEFRFFEVAAAPKIDKAELCLGKDEVVLTAPHPT